MRRVALVLAAVCLAATTSACTSGAPGDINKAATQVLLPAVQHVREVAAIGDYAELEDAVAQLKRLVAQQKQAGNVSSSRAAAILDAADVLLTDGRGKLSPSPTPTITTLSPTPTTTSPTPSPTTTTVSPTPTTTSPSPDVSVSVGTGNNGNGNGNGGGSKTSTSASP